MVWEKVKITADNGDCIDAQAPLIISASRSTDIPAFYSDWFFHRLKVGYSVWVNPFNNVKNYISYEKARLIVFWSKNPEPLLSHLDYLKQCGINCYIHFTLNDYTSEKLEMGVPSVMSRIDTFKRLVDKLGYGKVIWRFDPLLLTDTITLENLVKKVEYIGNQLYGYTEKLVFGFAEIQNYYKVKKNLMQNNIRYRDFTEKDMHVFAAQLCKLNKNWGYELATCSEKIDLAQYDVQKNKCIDDDLIVKYFSDDKILLDFLGIRISSGDLFDSGKMALKTKNNKDKGQRSACNCIISKDIGQYSTCVHLCEYCYANTSKEKAKANFQEYNKDKFSEMIVIK